MLKVQLMKSSPSEETKSGIWRVLCECDGDFVPSLSSRENTSQTDLKDSNIGNGLPHSYFNTILEQKVILLVLDGEVIGFMSFIHDYENEYLENYSPSNYVTTTCIKKDYRELGMAKLLNRFIEEKLPKELILPFITRRTWSTNKAQMHLFEKLNFDVVKWLDDHRGPGVHTVYFAKNMGV
jgi:ribosomal protein S18 acetylase RimI-like enzyme